MPIDAHAVDRPSAIAASTLLNTICLLPVMLTPYIVGAAARDLALDPRQLGLLAADLLGGAIVVMASSVFWVRICNWRALVACGAMIAIAGDLLASRAHGFLALVTLLGVASCGTGVVYAPSICALSDTQFPDRNFAYAFFLQIVVSGLTGFAITAFGQQWGLFGLLDLMAAFYGVALILAAWLPTKGAKNGTGKRAWPVPAAGLPIWGGLVGMLLLNAGPMAVWAFFERIGAAAGFSERSIGNGIAVAMLMGAPGALFSSIAIKRFGRVGPLTISTLATTATFAAAVLTHDFTVYMLSGLLFQFLVNFGLAFQYGAMSAADVSGRLIVLGPTFQGVGGMAGPAIAGMVVRDNGYGWVAVLGAAFAVSGLLLMLWLCVTLASGSDIPIPPNRCVVRDEGTL